MSMDERAKIEHQIELATRAAEYFRDETVVQRFRNFADQMRQRLARMLWRPKAGRSAAGPGSGILVRSGATDRDRKRGSLSDVA
jgi:hypothetical protein